jgi:isopentenyl phosphate kinase
MTEEVQPPSQNALVFLKLGGSLITDKLSPRTPRDALIQRIAGEVSAALSDHPHLSLVLGHGSGSYGHHSAQKYGTREGVSNPGQWLGFAEVCHDARTLNHLMMDALWAANVPAITFPPSAAAFASGGRISSWDLAPLKAALHQGVVPVVYGDVAFDHLLGGTILSTEDLFVHLAGELRPERILLAGTDPGVWRDYPDNTSLISHLTPACFQELHQGIRGSDAPDVTGGMISKVEQMLDLVSLLPEVRIRIFSGEEAGSIQGALSGAELGTMLSA